MNPLAPVPSTRRSPVSQRQLASTPAKHSPNDTRYPVPAMAAGLATGAAAAGGLLLTGLFWPVAAAVGAVGALAVSSSIKYADQWEKAVVLRLGRYQGLKGPGLFAVVPILDRVGYHIDQRIRTTAFAAESCLTRDTVPVDVDAIAFWVVYDAERAALEVQDYEQAVILAAQPRRPSASSSVAAKRADGSFSRQLHRGRV